MGVVSGTTAAIIGALALAGGTVAVQQRKKSKTQKAQRRATEQSLEEQKIATQQALAAPGKAAETARQESLKRRRGRARTILTSKTGVESPGTLLRKTLGGK